MKLSAISRRGLRRDFWDLYAMLQAGMRLEGAVAAWKKRFGRAAPDAYHLCRALTYFADAEQEATLPSGMTPALWRTIKRYFEEKAPRLLETR